MSLSTPSPPDSFRPILERYSRGEVSAYDAACDIQDLGEPGFHDPSASEVIHWARMIGLGPPIPDEAEARAEADRILDRMSGDPPDE